MHALRLPLLPTHTCRCWVLAASTAGASINRLCTFSTSPATQHSQSSSSLSHPSRVLWQTTSSACPTEASWCVPPLMDAHTVMCRPVTACLRLLRIGLCQNRAADTFLLMLTPQACLCCLDAATLPQPLAPQVSLMGNKQGELQLHQQLLRTLLPACACHSHSHSTCCTPSKSAATAHAHAQQAESRLTAHAHMQLEAAQVLNVACLPPQEGPLAGWQSLMQTSTLSLSILALKRTLRTSVSVLAPCRLHNRVSSTLRLLPCMQSGWQHKAECHL